MLAFNEVAEKRVEIDEIFKQEMDNFYRFDYCDVHFRL